MSTRRQQLLDTAARLFAERGFTGVSVNDIGEACGVSGPALYKHFRSKDELLAEALTTVSDHLVAEARRRLAEAPGATEALASLITGHVDFALREPALIVIQDREWTHLGPADRDRVRAVQREYIDLWVDTVRAVRPERDVPTTRAGVQAVFGLINSTPRSARIANDRMRALLQQMATAALVVDDQS